MVTSRDGYNSYLLIVDAHTRYSWVFLSATKEPPINIIQTFLDRNGVKDGTQRQIRCDQSGELARSSRSREAVEKCEYSVEPTSADSSSQKGVAERPNRTYGNIMRTMLYNAGIGPEFWSYALIQVVFVKNRLPHSYHNHTKTPYEAFTGRKKNIANIKIFGSKGIAKKSTERGAKLDDNTAEGIFLHHTASTSIHKFLDIHTGREKITSHLDFDEAHYTSANKPLGSAVLLRQGYKSTSTPSPSHLSTSVHPDDIHINEPHTPSSPNEILQTQRLSSKAIVPTKATEGSAGLDLHSSEDATLLPGDITLIPTDIAIVCPAGTYGRIAPRSGLIVKRHLDVPAGVVDVDYRGNLLVAMQNIGKEKQHLPAGTKIAQLVIEKIANVNVQEKATLDSTKRGDAGFGSTDKATPPSFNPYAPPSTIDVVPCNPDEITPTVRSFSSPAHHIYISSCPFGPTLIVPITVKGDHPTLGLSLDDRNMTGRLLLTHMEKSTPAYRIKK